MSQYRFPVWFRAAMAALFTAVFLVYFVVKDGLAGSAIARSFASPALRTISPLLQLQALLSHGRPDDAPKGGAYTINGMRVAFDTIPAPLGDRETLARFAAGFQKAGFKYRVVETQGRYTLVGIHPKTKVMLTVRPERDRAGRSIARLSQQNLAELDPHFRAEIPGIPMVPGTAGGMLVTSLEGPPTQSLMYASTDSAEWIQEFYEHELDASGWQRLPPPMEPPASMMTILFFAKGSQECSVLAMANPQAGGSLVLINVGGKATGKG
jgi:hypothetical protein